MAINSETGVDFETDRFVVRTNGVITHFNKQWNRLDGGPIVDGFGPGEEWFKKMEPKDRSGYDHRYAVTGEWACIAANPAPPVGYPNGTYEETLTAEFRPIQELKDQVSAAKRMANASIYPEGDDPSERALVDAARFRDAAGIADATDLSVLARHASKLDKLKQNEEREQALFALIEDPAGIQLYDITEGWQYGPSEVAG